MGIDALPVFWGVLQETYWECPIILEGYGFSPACQITLYSVQPTVLQMHHDTHKAHCWITAELISKTTQPKVHVLLKAGRLVEPFLT